MRIIVRKKAKRYNMSVQSIIIQPNAGDLLAAYRPVLIDVNVDTISPGLAPPIIYCDVYFNGIYYKTVSRTKSKSLASGSALFEFDIQDAAQEIIGKYIGDNGSSSLNPVTNMMLSCFCRIRVTSYDTNGLMMISDIAPVQGTGAIAPIPGSGYQSNSFFIAGMSLQHEDNQNTVAHLNSYKNGNWGANVYPMTHRPQGYVITKKDSDFYPFINLGLLDFKTIRLNYKVKGSNNFLQASFTQISPCPVVSNIQYTTVNNGANQTFTFTWANPSPLITGIDILYRPSGGTGSWSTSSGSAASGRSITVPFGSYDVQFLMHGSCSDNYSGIIMGVGATGSGSCLPVLFTDLNPTIPDGNTQYAYNYALNLYGDAPFALTNVVKPAWMTIAIVGTQIIFTGQPTIGGNGIPVFFTVTNCGGTNSATFNKTINIMAPVNGAINVLYGYNAMTVGYPSANGTINAPAGSIVNVRFKISGIDAAATLNGNVYGNSFNINNAVGKQEYSITMPPSGQINWSMFLNTTSSAEGAYMELF